MPLEQNKQQQKRRINFKNKCLFLSFFVPPTTSHHRKLPKRQRQKGTKRDKKGQKGTKRDKKGQKGTKRDTNFVPFCPFLSLSFWQFTVIGTKRDVSPPPIYYYRISPLCKSHLIAVQHTTAVHSAVTNCTAQHRKQEYK